MSPASCSSTSEPTEGYFYGVGLYVVHFTECTTYATTAEKLWKRWGADFGPEQRWELAGCLRGAQRAGYSSGVGLYVVHFTECTTYATTAEKLWKRWEVDFGPEPAGDLAGYLRGLPRAGYSSGVGLYVVHFTECTTYATTAEK